MIRPKTLPLWQQQLWTPVEVDADTFASGERNRKKGMRVVDTVKRRINIMIDYGLAESTAPPYSY